MVQGVWTKEAVGHSPSRTLAAGFVPQYSRRMVVGRAEGNPLVHVPGADVAGGEALPAYSPDGVDLTQIRAMLRLTPEQRLQVLQDMIDFVAEATGGSDSGENR
jgi:hypothetical protein